MRDKVLIVDDVTVERSIFTHVLMEDFTILYSDSGEEALEMIEQHSPELAVILLKLALPENKDGIKILETMNERGWIQKIPVLAIAADGSAEEAGRCFELGIMDFIRKPFDETIIKGRVLNIAKKFIRQAELEEKLEQQIRTIKKQFQIVKMQADGLEKSKLNTIEILGTVIGYRNMETETHIGRIKEMTKILAEEMMERYPEYELTPKKIQMIVSASALHDIGKIAIPDHILLKPAKLTKEEFDYIKSHAAKGCEILGNIRGVWDEEHMKVNYDVFRFHHERYDGNGYPDGLKGDEIPVSAQLAGLVDAYDALVSERVYRKAYSKDQAFHMIVLGECGMFSTKLIDCLNSARGKIEALVEDLPEVAGAED